MHLAVDTDTGLIHAVQTTSNEVADGTVLPDLLNQVAEPIAVVRADGHLFQMTVAATTGVRVTPRLPDTALGRWFRPVRGP